MTERKPEWTPAGGGQEFACRVVAGVAGGHDGLKTSQHGTASAVTSNPSVRRRQLSVEDYVTGILSGDRMLLARAITLIESNALKHAELAQAVLKEILPYTGKAQRIGITGVPGAGKSTFIEALGCWLCDQGHRVAVLAVDPSSSITKGSILGDKTRMEQLSKRPEAFIRPSPAGGTLGGVARKSRETMLLCEAAGYDVLLIETVGVGQSEVTVRSMVDFFLLLVLTGAGDELQGMKKGVMELADAILVNKADGDNQQRARNAQADYNQILHYLQPATAGWKTQAYTCSALTGAGIKDIWQTVQLFLAVTGASGVLTGRRQQQTLAWVYAMVNDHLQTQFFSHPAVASMRSGIEAEVLAGRLPPSTAVQQLIKKFTDK